jgi:hypothetical protein
MQFGPGLLRCLLPAPSQPATSILVVTMQRDREAELGGTASCLGRSSEGREAVQSPPVRPVDRPVSFGALAAKISCAPASTGCVAPGGNVRFGEGVGAFPGEAVGWKNLRGFVTARPLQLVTGTQIREPGPGVRLPDLELLPVATARVRDVQTLADPRQEVSMRRRGGPRP